MYLAETCRWMAYSRILGKVKPMSEVLKLSIVTPSFNHGRFLERTILSVINQDYTNVEHIIIDGASQDNSLEIIRKYEKYISYWVSEPDKDLRYALNKGFARASGDVVAWQNADDYYEPNVLGQVMRVFQERPDVDLVYGNINIVNENDQLIDKLFHIPLYYPLDLFGGLPFQNHAAFFRRRLWEQGGGITYSELNYDADLIFRLARLAHPYFINRSLAAYRNHNASITFSGKFNYLRKDRWAIRRRFLGKWGKLQKWVFMPVVILSKSRRYLCLALLGEWDYFTRQAKKILDRVRLTTRKTYDK